jgi:hypothetical protein
VRFLMDSDTLADLADGDDADVHLVVVRVLQPLRHTRVRLWTGQLRRNIRIKKEAPAHPRSTGRLADFIAAEIEVQPAQWRKDLDQTFAASGTAALGCR